MTDPAPRQPAWLAGLAPGGQVLRATRAGTTDGLYFLGLAAFGALLVALTVLRNGNLLIAAGFGVAVLVIGASGLRTIRLARGGAPILAYDSAGLYVPGAGCVRWTDIRGFRVYPAGRTMTIALELEPSRQARLSRWARLRGLSGRGYLTIGGSMLPVSIKKLLEAIDPHYHAATGRHVRK